MPRRAISSICAAIQSACSCSPICIRDSRSWIFGLRARITPLECGVERRELRIHELAVAIEDLADVAPDAELAVSVFCRVSPSGEQVLGEIERAPRFLPRLFRHEFTELFGTPRLE